MAEYTEEYEIVGPRGTKTGKAFVDTGASFTVIPAPVAEELGLEPYRPEIVDTNNGPVRWGVARADVGVGGKPTRNQDVFIAPGENPLAIGAETLQISGFKLRAGAARARLSICGSCPEKQHHPYLGDICGLCRQRLPLADRVETADCPIGKW